MNICVFGKYKVEVTGYYTYKDEDGEFSAEKYKDLWTMDGCKLIEKISEELSDLDLITFCVKDNKICFEKFDPHSGEDASCAFTITEVKE